MDGEALLAKLGIERGTVVKCGCGRNVYDDALAYCKFCRVEKHRPPNWRPRPGDDPNLVLELSEEEAARLAEIRAGNNRKRVQRRAG